MLSIKTSLTVSTCKIMRMSSSVAALVTTSAVVSDVTSRHFYRGVKPGLHRGLCRSAICSRGVLRACDIYGGDRPCLCRGLASTVALPLEAFGEDSPQAISFDY